MDTEPIALPLRATRKTGLLPHLVLALAVAAGLVGGIEGGLSGEAEWSYYEQLVRGPLALTSGPDKPIFGYLPGCKGLLAPFVHTEPVGSLLFAALNALACVGIVALLRRHLARAHDPASAHLWLAICSAVPIWFTLQNNQLVAPAVYLTLVAFVRLREGREYVAGATFALAVLIKTLPLPVLLLAVVWGRWRAVATAGLTLGVLSLGLATLTDGPSEAWASHLRWPAQVAAQDPELALVEASTPRSFRSNQGPEAQLVRLANALGEPRLAQLHAALTLGALFALAAFSALAGPRSALYWPLIAGWLAWVAFAAPFGRYYYLLFLVPAAYLVGQRVWARAGRSALVGRWALGLGSFALLLARSNNPLYALCATAVLLAILIHLAREVRRDRNEGAELDPQAPVKRGLRFSAKAARASRRSWVGRVRS